ncbi:TIGR03087 family PEP-CTERM/XrtA system glycosyltransferase [Roseococcus pinisoli]|uniref:TIGR03087 family PEP-CTERM/XrtA system glycosyltransferase n=1 Tax=Roseococcus pinisoli TaxID=2835040 RepID=A0ABS5QF99_9PROT|nr:TIGR03087 family PEP-CTERM/XrtA system glycosyltransferase [Roseococcus pinisoli]MBS7812048.1 TIGR03087 family PEP-CTERM/XrtA system glycosyltransferase [Roseococcus pinisoli]
MGGRLLFLCHRIPFPPDKGDKIRAWHMLEHLAQSWEVDLGCLVDDRADFDHVPALKRSCATVEARWTGSRAGAAIRAVRQLRPGRPLSLGWFHEPGLRAWTEDQLARGRHDAVFVYSSSMAPYLMGAGRPGLRRILDMVDVDSEKWRAYADAGRAPMRQVWAREARTLLAFERAAAADFDCSLFVSEAEAAHFAALAPECAGRVDHVDNGVALGRFDPARRTDRPFSGRAPTIVFTGTMDYRPNIEAVSWFAREVMPMLSEAEFHIVGANPTAAVRALAQQRGVHVTGTVPDVRPYLAHAAVVVAPLRIARGIQNKVLEAMAMARPVVASPEAFEGVRARAGRDILVAEGALETARRIREVLDGEHPDLGAAGRAAVMAGHDWRATLQRLDHVLESAEARDRMPA